MKIIGIDIGTTSISGVLLNTETGAVIERETLPNTAGLSDKGSQGLQSPEEIIRTVSSLSVLKADGISAIGVTGQMHGILYLNADGEPISPLYTWQDRRGAELYKDGLTYAGYLSKKTGYRLATGYGLATHFVNIVNGLVPNNAKTLCTIGDYVSAWLGLAKAPAMHPTNAHSIGFYNIQTGFGIPALRSIGIDCALLPEIAKDSTVIGKTKSGVPVASAIGDNQASVLGASVSGGRVVANVGTGSQISVVMPDTYALPRQYGENIEVRPYLSGNVLLTGAALTGGDAYKLLERFFAETAEMLGLKDLTASDIYEKMDGWLSQRPAHENTLKVDARFNGTRANPELRGSITQIDAKNLRPENLIRGFLTGIAEELHHLYTQMPDTGCEFIMCTGNGLRKNKHLLQIFEGVFGKNIKIAPYEEEAASGAALFAAGLLRKSQSN